MKTMTEITYRNCYTIVARINSKDKGITQKETPIAWGKDERHEGNQRKSQFRIWKNCRMEKKLYV